jgi:hypothetical protein
VDLGTEFGVVAGPEPEVHVFEGEVEVHTRRRYILRESVGLRLEKERPIGIPARRERFIGERQLAAMQASADMDAHPAALVRYDFETEGSEVTNRVASVACPAAIVGAMKSEGRWPGEHALELVRKGARAEFAMPEPLKSLTFVAWVQVDHLPERQGGLLMGSSDGPGDVHWYLYQDGSMGFAMVGEDGMWHPMHTRPLFGDGENQGAWKMVAASYDGDTGSVVQYLDGEPVGTWQAPAVEKVSPGRTAIGNWALRPGAAISASRSFIYGDADYDRSFPGRIDEIAVFSVVLGADEIRSFFEGGKP